jgi:uncharacterized protein with ParB-like and HNH nuclease domain
MDLHAYTKSIGDLLSVNKKYIVPRFQREYSWKNEEVLELWKDLSSSIKVKDGSCLNFEYFIGSLVLVGQDSSPEMKIVDGQQRLTTITILLSALIQTFQDISEKNLADGIYFQYIEGKDNTNQPYFKLINETPKPFFQRGIQFQKKESIEASNEEETKLLEAYKFFIDKLSFDSIKSNFRDFSEINGSDSEKHKHILNAVRDQILNYLKVIYITVSDEEDAYTIFETLNARGMSLSAVDLIKNLIFKDLKTQHPDDFAKTEWKKIRENISKGETNINIDTFFRHFWLSKYGFTSEGRIYKAFKDYKDDNIISSSSFLDELVVNSEYYNSIVNPNIDDWTLPEEKTIYNSLLALNLFKVVQPRPLLLALKRARINNKINVHDHVNMIRTLENFHFSFTAICSSRASGIDGKYSKAARDIEESTTKKQARAILTSLTSDLRTKIPIKSIFEQKFITLWFTNGRTKDKKLIQYIFRTIEKSKRMTSELTTDMITLEHIRPQSDSSASKYVGTIGNLLPLDGKINNVADTAVFQEKLIYFRSSELKMVEEFVLENTGVNSWTEAKVNNRSKSLSDYSYDHAWNI